MFRVVFSMLLCICSTMFADQNINSDSSILSISNEQAYLNPEKLLFKDGGIFLETDAYGLIQLNQVLFDGENYYCGSRVFGGVYICTNCHWMGDHRPSECPRCGETDFYLSDLYPE